MNEVTRILSAFEQDDPHAAELLLPVVYDELRKLARQMMNREKPGQTLNATALVHEAFVRLVGGEEGAAQRGQHWDDRRHFFAAAAEAMRRILVENARRRKRLKHGGGKERVDLNDDLLAIEEPAADLDAVDQALEQFACEDAEAAELIKLHYFVGMTIEEAAVVLGISARTAYRNWAYARAWLHRRLSNNL